MVHVLLVVAQMGAGLDGASRYLVLQEWLGAEGCWARGCRRRPCPTQTQGPCSSLCAGH